MGDPAPGKLEADRKGWFIRDYFPDGVCPVSNVLLDGAGTGTGIGFGASSMTTGIDMSSATISGDDIVLSASGVIMAATSIGFEIAGTSKLAITSTTVTVTGSSKINLDGPVDVSGILTIDKTGSPADGIKINATTPVDGLEIASACSGYAINISGDNTGRALSIGTKATAGSSLPITATAFENEPGNNYLFGLFTAVATTAANSLDELRSTWIRTRVNEGCDIGCSPSAPYGFGVCGAEIQLKFYADNSATTTYGWQNSAVWAQLETQGTSTVTFEDGTLSSCLLANVGLTNTTVIASGAVVAGVAIHSNSSSTGGHVTTTGDYVGMYIAKASTGLTFEKGIYISDDSVTTGIEIGNATTGMKFDGTFTTAIKFEGDAAYNPIHIGTKANTATGGLNMNGQDSYDNQGGIMMFCDDGGVALATTYTTSAIWTRYLITANQTSNTATGAYLQMKLKKAAGTLDLTTSDYSATKVYVETDSLVDLKSGDLYVLSTTFEMGNDFTNTAGSFAGINVEINDKTNTLTGNGYGVLIRKNSSSTAGWPVGLMIEDSGATTGIDIGACSSYGILMDDTYTNAIRITTSVATTAYTGIRLLNTYTAADGYHVGIMGAAVYDPTAGQGYGAVIGVYGEANINGNFTGGTNWSFGVRGTLQLRNDTVINNASSIFGAINASMKDDATPTLTAGHVCGVYIENLIDADLSSISGIATMLYIANNASATCTLNSAIYLYGPKITYFAQFAADCNVAGCISSAAPNAAASRYIKVEIEGSEYKVLAQSEA